MHYGLAPRGKEDGELLHSPASNGSGETWQHPLLHVGVRVLVDRVIFRVCEVVAIEACDVGIAPGAKQLCGPRIRGRLVPFTKVNQDRLWGHPSEWFFVDMRRVGDTVSRGRDPPDLVEVFLDVHRASHLVDYDGSVAERNVLIEERSNDRNPTPGVETGRVQERWNVGGQGFTRLGTARRSHSNKIKPGVHAAR